MCRFLFFASLLVIFTVPTLANNNESCAPSASDSPSMQFDYEHPYEEMPAIYAELILAYLDSGASLEELVSNIEAANADYVPHYGQLIQADFTADNQNEILLHMTVSWGGTFSAYLMLFTCEEDNNRHLATVSYGGWDTGGYGQILYALDVNNNQLRDIVLEYPTVEGMKGHDTIRIYEWDGDSLEQSFLLGPYYGGFNNIQFTYNANDATSPNLNVGYFYAYEEETASAFIEYSVIRPINMIYQWDGSDYRFICQHFTDEPSMYPTTLHSAESYRACGDYETAARYYEQIFELAWQEPNVNNEYEYDRGSFSTWPSIVFPENLRDYEEQALFVKELERAYYEAFAAYRLLQIALESDDSWSAESQINRLNSSYPQGEHGYVYRAMANALWQNYQDTSDLVQACEAAALAFDEAYSNGDEPGIRYQDDPNGYHYGFYFANMRSYAADPDNLFAVPDSIDGMVSTPICL